MRASTTAPMWYLLLTCAMAAMLSGCVTKSESPQPQPMPPPVAEAVPAPVIPPAPAPAPAPVPVSVSEKVSFAAEVFFAPHQDTLRPEGKASLDELVSKINGISIEGIFAVGHTDSSETDADATAHSVSRAKAVKTYLISKGIEPGRIFAEGKGKTQPVARNNSAAGRAKNNRAEIEVLGIRTSGPGLAESPREWIRNRMVPVMFATNRKATGSRNPIYFYGNEMNDKDGAGNLQRGITYVKIPPRHMTGKVEGPGWVVATIRRSPLAPVLPKFAAVDPDNEFILEQKIELLDKASFDERMKYAIETSKGKAAVLYVHGYANDFTDAAFRTAQISYDLATRDFEIVPMMFSWPSDAGAGGVWYPEAKHRTDWAARSLAIFLKEIAAATDIGTIHIIAHSMGASVLVKAMANLATPEFGGQSLWALNKNFRQIVFAAADVSPDIFQTVIQPAIKSRHTVTNYISNKDKAIMASTVVNRSAIVGNYFRDERLVQCVDTVDVSAVAAFGLAHSTWAESERVLDDLREVLSTANDPDKRGLKKRGKVEKVLWIVDRKAPVVRSSKSTLAALVPCESSK
jgi:esterase/lipase superfamily enzyme/outer membrane protein OmpA-like peptidoglycan-associated protein